MLLIEAHGHDRFRAVQTHAGGCVWYGRWLYVADNGTLLVFDLSRMMDIAAHNPDYATSNSVGMHEGVPHAAGYRYLLPLARRYDFRSESATRAWPAGGGPFDSLGLDRSTTPHRLMAGSFIIPAPADPGAGCENDCDPTHALVMTWDLDAHTGALTSLAARSFELFDGHRQPELYVQGVLGLDGDIWVVKSKGRGHHALHRHELYHAEPDRYDWPTFGEGITFNPRTNTFWCVKEYSAGDRCVFVTAVPGRPRRTFPRAYEDTSWAYVPPFVPPLSG